jgi:hypothetical protein
MRFARVRSAVIGVFAAGAAACGTVLGLGDYRDAPRDAGATAQSDAESSETRDAGPPPADDAGQEATGAAQDAADGAAQDAADGGGQDAADDGAQDAPFDGAAPMDAASTDASLCVGADAMSCFSVPGGWTLVAFANSSQTTCPTGFSVQNDVVFGAAQPAANACTCDSCSVTAQPSCVQGQLNGTYDFDGSQTCRAGSLTLANSSPGGCNTDNFHGTLRKFDVQWVAPAPTGGTCSAAPTAHADRISFAGQGRACSPQSDAGAGCADGGVCAPTIAAPFLLCLSQAGNAACPAGPFGVAYHVGTGAVPTCATACACTVNATCTNKTVTYYADSSCQSTTTLPVAANGVCQVASTSMGPGTSYGSYMYSATANATCGVSGNPGVSAVGLANQETICCAQ